MADTFGDDLFDVFESQPDNSKETSQPVQEENNPNTDNKR